MRTNRILDLSPKIVVDLFAGGGGVSEGVEMALGYPPHVAVNHNADALSMHRMNHPFTKHFVADVFEVDPKGIVSMQGRPVGALHLSPDCTHHSQARGGQPRDRKIRALTWVAARWAGQVKPDVITLENVKQILRWGPLVAKRDPATGRVIKIDRTIAMPGERVPLSEQFLVPDPKKTGRTWNHFVHTLKKMGYEVEVKKLIAADYGTATSRERLFMIARCDGLPIVWPTPRYFKRTDGTPPRWRAASDVIDWNIECPSIFSRKKPLAPATMKRIAVGLKKFVLDNPEPFIVPIAHYNGSNTVYSANEPLRTIVASTKGGEFAVAAPVMVQAGHGEGRPNGVKRWGSGARSVHDPMGTITASGGGQAVAAATLVQTGYGERNGQAPRALDIDAPLGTIVSSGKHALSTAYLMQCNGGFNTTVGRAPDEPMTTVTNTGSQQQLVVGNLIQLRNHCDGRSLADPLQTISAGGEHHALCEFTLSSAQVKGAARVAAFLIEYYGEGNQWGAVDEPLHAVTTRDRMALVTVTISGTPYVIVDIGLRMLTPRELFCAQGFRPDYIIDHGDDGRKFSKKTQVRMVGNSVPPQVIEAIYRANLVDLAIRKVA